MLRYLWLIRHAKSSWADDGARDHDRTLNNRGLRDGPVMAQWLGQQPHPAEWIWVSSAVRAQKTAKFVQDAFAGHAAAPSDKVIQSVTESQLYGAFPETIMDVVHATPPDVASAAVVAHNPGITQLVNQLAGQHVTVNMPTFGVALFELDRAWSDVVHGKLLSLVGPKTLPEHSANSG